MELAEHNETQTHVSKWLSESCVIVMGKPVKSPRWGPRGGHGGGGSSGKQSGDNHRQVQGTQWQEVESGRKLESK